MFYSALHLQQSNCILQKSLKFDTIFFMQIHGYPYHTIWLAPETSVSFFVIDQRILPHEVKTIEITSSDAGAEAIANMTVRGAPLIGVTAAYSLYLATLEAPHATMDHYIRQQASRIGATRPTAVNLNWALHEMLKAIEAVATPADKIAAALQMADTIKTNDIAMCRQIGVHGMSLIRDIYTKKNGATVNILTHCNAGWLACVDWGTATSPIYHAQLAGIPVHVWVDETRPRNQGANLTCFELGQQGIAHTLIADNTGGHLMQHGMVDMVITGADRVTANGDVANKIGTYLKALAAKDNGIPFYAALPYSTIDWSIHDGIQQIPIEQRNPDELRYASGWYEGRRIEVLVCPEATTAANYGFDVTPARLVTGIITEKGIATPEALQKMYVQ
jgi:methylthioribose-1-phosphate isomerase